MSLLKRKFVLDLFFKENLRLLRKARKMSQSDLAEILNYSFRTISKWETGETLPYYENIIKISKIFNISIQDLMENDLSKNKTFIIHSSKIIDNKSLFKEFEKSLYEVLYTSNNEVNTKRTFLKKHEILINESPFPESINSITKKEKIDLQTLELILYKTLESLKLNSLIEFFNLYVTNNYIDIEYKTTFLEQFP